MVNVPFDLCLPVGSYLLCGAPKISPRVYVRDLNNIGLRTFSVDSARRRLHLCCCWFLPSRQQRDDDLPRTSLWRLDIGFIYSVSLFQVPATN
jgi:hypothetical protein